MARRGTRRRGQAMMEYIMLFVGVILPLTFGLIAIAQMMWIWHSVVDFTRLGARYAATHCWQAGGANVVEWMRQNVPPIPDQSAFRDGGVELLVEYYKKNPDTGLPEEFSCDGECSVECIPDSVTVRVRNYEYRFFLTYMGLPPVQIPDFSASMPVEGAGCDPELGTCTP
ncbi:MAG: pilus assembly protein [Candidatus Solibacter usitatus]|nr:pilus assembly protein [Candidatus Solibacter usitatus]